MKLTYTARAGKDLIRLREFIRKKNPKAAQQASRQLRKNIQALLDQPQMGVPVEALEGVQELIAREYIVRYYVAPGEIVILNVWHEKEDR